MSDSHGRGFGKTLSKTFTKEKVELNILNIFKPNAKIDSVVNVLKNLTNHCSLSDFIIIQGGTNDILSHKYNLNSICKTFSQIPLNIKNTNIIFSTIPYIYKHRKHVLLNQDIYKINSLLCNLSRKHGNIHFFDVNTHITEKHFNRDGIHLNNHGKSIKATKLKEKLCDLITNIKCCKPINVITNTFKNIETNFIPHQCIMNIT